MRKTTFFHVQTPNRNSTHHYRRNWPRDSVRCRESLFCFLFPGTIIDGLRSPAGRCSEKLCPDGRLEFYSLAFVPSFLFVVLSLFAYPRYVFLLRVPLTAQHSSATLQQVTGAFSFCAFISCLISEFLCFCFNFFMVRIYWLACLLCSRTRYSNALDFPTLIISGNTRIPYHTYLRLRLFCVSL